MSVAVPNALALGVIADGSLMVASDVRNDFTATQVGVNGLIAMFAAAPTKGDLLVSAGGGSFDRLGVGTDGQAIVADSTQALGMKWAGVAASRVIGKRTTSVSTVGTTYAAGADVLASPLSFTADGSSDYLVTLATPQLTNPGIITFAFNLDSAEAGVFTIVGNSEQIPTTRGILLAPSAAAHTLNVRFFVSTGTGTLAAGVGGTTNNVPIVLSIEKA